MLTSEWPDIGIGVVSLLHGMGDGEAQRSPN